MITSEKLCFLLLRKFKIGFLLFVLLFSNKMVAQSIAAASEGVLFVTEDVIVFSDSTTISEKIVILNSSAVEKKSNLQKTTIEKGQRSLSKSLIKKKKTIVIAKNKTNRVFSDVPSHQDLQNEIGFVKNSFAPNQNYNFNNELAFHYKALNIPIFVHLEKIYFEEISLSTEFSNSFFSRPPPIL